MKVRCLRCNTVGRIVWLGLLSFAAEWPVGHWERCGQTIPVEFEP